MSEYAKNIQTIEDMWKKRIELPKLTEIVRCRDCKFGVYGGKYCAEGCADSWEWRNVEPNGFCAWAERRQP